MQEELSARTLAGRVSCILSSEFSTDDDATIRRVE
jgi:hypothetical protein